MGFMVDNKTPANIDLKNLIILAPLAIVTIFCLSFVQMKAISTQKSLRQDAALTQQNTNTKALPLITQPSLPTLNTTVDTKAPAPVPPPTNPYDAKSHKSDMVGPSSKNSGNALQPNSENLNSSQSNELQATRKAIRLEDAKL